VNGVHQNSNVRYTVLPITGSILLSGRVPKLLATVPTNCLQGKVFDNDRRMVYRHGIIEYCRQIPQGLIGNPVRIGSGPAAVNGDEIR
jgi:hypothetical protein